MDALTLTWFLIMGFAILMYVLLDGFVLGLGVMMPFAKSEDQRDLMMNTAAPIWDGNETWLVLGGVGLFAAFPSAYATILSSLYLPVLLMLLALVFRGVSFEFRFKAIASKKLWGWTFFGGSLIAAFAQGIMLGALVSGLAIDAGAFAWLAPFPLMCGLAVTVGYALLGATWLILKTDDELCDLSRDMALKLVVGIILFMAVVSCWVPFLSDHYYQRWFSGNNIWMLLPLPLITAINGIWLWRSVKAQAEWQPFVAAMLMFVLGFAGLVVSLWPYLVPFQLTVVEAAAPKSTQSFTLVGALMMLPVVLGYTIWSYYIFRGKITAETAYH